MLPGCLHNCGNGWSGQSHKRYRGQDICRVLAGLKLVGSPSNPSLRSPRVESSSPSSNAPVSLADSLIHKWHGKLNTSGNFPAALPELQSLTDDAELRRTFEALVPEQERRRIARAILTGNLSLVVNTAKSGETFLPALNSHSPDDELAKRDRSANTAFQSGGPTRIRRKFACASIRGMVRWWFRAARGTSDEEKEAFGGMKRFGTNLRENVNASRLVFRVSEVRAQRGRPDPSTLPHKQGARVAPRLHSPRAHYSF